MTAAVLRTAIKETHCIIEVYVCLRMLLNYIVIISTTGMCNVHKSKFINFMFTVPCIADLY